MLFRSVFKTGSFDQYAEVVRTPLNKKYPQEILNGSLQYAFISSGRDHVGHTLACNSCAGVSLFSRRYFFNGEGAKFCRSVAFGSRQESFARSS